MESVATDFGAGQQMLLNLILAVMVFGLALDINPKEFARLYQRPRGPLTGIAAQFLVLPVLTFLLTLAIDLDPGIELGMIMVAACPGGASSNFITFLARGNVALSITMTALASMLAIFMLPFNFSLWAGLNSETAAVLQSFEVGAGQIFQTLLVVLAIPLLCGQLVRAWNQPVANRLHRLLNPLSVLILVTFIIVAVSRNMALFLSEFWLLFGVVLVHNTGAFLAGFLSAKSAGLDGADTRAVTVEVGIQNSSLAIAIIFTWFPDEPGMAMVAAFWGTWHLIAGFLFAGAARWYLRSQETGPKS